jgi:hypothetical protein
MDAAVSKALASDASHPTNAQHSARHKKGMDAFFMPLYNLPIHSSIFIRCSRPENRRLFQHFSCILPEPVVSSLSLSLSLSLSHNTHLIIFSKKFAPKTPKGSGL